MSATSVRDALYDQLLEVENFTGENVTKHDFGPLNKGAKGGRLAVVRFADGEHERLTFTLIQSTWTYEIDLFEKESTPAKIEAQAMIDIQAIMERVVAWPHLGEGGNTIRSALMTLNSDSAEEIVVGSTRYFKYLLTVDVVEQWEAGYQE